VTRLNVWYDRLSSLDTGGAGQSFEVDSTVAAAALLGFHGLALVVILLQHLGVPVPLQVGVPVVFLALTFVPGGLILLCLYPGGRVGVSHVLYAFGVSLMTLMAIGFVLNLVLPPLGYDTPMARLPVTVAITAVDLGLTAMAINRSRGQTVRVSLPRVLSPVPLAFLLLPLLSIDAVALLNRTGNNAALLLVLVIAALVPLAVVVGRVSTTYLPLGVWCVALAVLYHKAFWKYSGYSGQPYAIRIWETGRWNPGVAATNPLSAELLPNGVLYPMYARVTGVHILTQYNVVNPFLVSFLPVALFVTFRRYTDPYRAFLGASLFAFAHPFFRQYPTAGRVATPVLFLALFSVAISDRDTPRAIVSGLSLVFVLGIAVSHYGTSYYVMAAFAGALLLFVLSRWFVDITTMLAVREMSFSSPGTLLARASTRLSLSLVLFYSVATLTWYMFLRGGRKFDLLPKHVRESYQQLLGGSTFSGRTAARIQKNYGTESILYSKYLYFAVAILIALGLLVVLYRGLSSERTDFDDYYYVIAVAILGIFGTTVMVRNWGGGRPMMITFVFTAIFAVVGLVAIGEFLLDRRREAIAFFGVLLVVLFVLNSGVASAVFFGGLAPSNVPNQHELSQGSAPRAVTTVYKETDVQTHVWFVNHYEKQEVHGGTFANRQKDWYRPDIDARTTGVSSAYGPTGTVEGKPLGLHRLARPGVEPGFVLLLGHNLALGGVWSVQYGPPAATLDELELSRRNRVYTTGESAIYHVPEDSE